jgi:hypothetical protein
MTTHYIRNSNNETIAEVEAMKDDLSAVVCIAPFSRELLERANNLLIAGDLDMFIGDFDGLQEIRGKFFETLHDMAPVQMAAEECQKLCRKWDYYYVVD